MFASSWGQVERLTSKGHKWTFCDMEIFCISIVVVITQLYTLIKTHVTVLLKRVKLTVCKLYFNKPDFNFLIWLSKEATLEKIGRYGWFLFGPGFIQIKDRTPNQKYIHELTYHLQEATSVYSLGRTGMYWGTQISNNYCLPGASLYIWDSASKEKWKKWFWFWAKNIQKHLTILPSQISN